MYQDKFVMTVHVNGQLVQDHNDLAVLAPGVEYSLRFRNKHKDRRAVVRFTIDGEDVSGKGGYVIPANDSIEIERFYDRPVRFRLAEEGSDAAYMEGKNGFDDSHGVIVASFFLEEHRPISTFWGNSRVNSQPSPYTRRVYGCLDDLGTLKARGLKYESSARYEDSHSQGMSLECDSAPDSVRLTGMGFAPPVDPLVTVEGSQSSQRFGTERVNISGIPTAVMTMKLVSNKPNWTQLKPVAPVEFYETRYLTVEQPIAKKTFDPSCFTPPSAPTPVITAENKNNAALEQVADENARLELEIAQMKNELLKKQAADLKRQLEESSDTTVAE